MPRLSASIVIALLLTSCSSDWHLRQAIAKDPSILTEGREVVTILDTVTVTTEALRVDTLHRWSVDTVTTYVDRVRIRTKVDTIERTVFVDVTCPPDTIRVPYERQIITVKPNPKSNDLQWIIILVAIILGTLAFMIRRN